MADKKELTLRQKLKKLFTSSIIYRPKGKNKTIVIDPNRLMSVGSPSNTKAANKYAKVYRNTQGFDVFGAQSMYMGKDNTTVMQARINLYSDYEMMDTNAIISSALDIYADECTTKNEVGEILTIKTNDPEIKELLTNLFYDILDINFNLWPWVRNMCKYGDNYLGLHVQDHLGILNAVPLSSYFMIRREGSEESPYDISFELINPESMGNMNGNRTIYSNMKDKNIDIFENYEIAHFRMLSDSNFLPYGKAMIEGVRKDFKSLLLLEDAMLLHRIMRSAEKRLFKIDIGNLPEEEIDAFMEKIMSGMKKIPHVDEDTGEYNLRFNIQNMLEDFYLPVRGDSSGMSIESLPGLEYTPTEDLEFIRSKIFAGLKIPKAFLGYDEQAGSRSTLSMEDVRFARTIDRIQKMVLGELTKMAVIHLYAIGIEDERLANFSLSLTNPSLIAEQEKIEMLNQKVDLAVKMKDSKLISRDYIYTNVFEFSEMESERQANLALEDIKLLFREAQIESEGNDPKVTKESVGTAWDIASMHARGRVLDEDDEFGEKDKGGSEEGGQPGAGRPKSTNRYGSRRSKFGRDPISKKDLINQTFTEPTYDDKINKKYKTGSIFSFENKKPKKGSLREFLSKD